MDQYWTRNEQEQYVQRMEDEHRRQNHRTTELEEQIKQYGSLTLSVEKLAINMTRMLEEQKSQGKRLEALESRDGEKWRDITKYLMTTGIGLVVGYLFNVAF